VRRAERTAPGLKVSEILAGVPLAFGLNSPASLTAKTATNGRTIYYGVRREYREAADHWLDSSGSPDLHIQSGARPFPVPGMMLPVPRAEVACDILVIEDFNGPNQGATLEDIRNAAAKGLKVASFHWPHFDARARERLSIEVRQLAQNGDITIVSPGEAVRSKQVIVADPTIADHEIDRFPDIQTDGAIVLTSQGAPPTASQIETLERVLKVRTTSVDRSDSNYLGLP
jgi:hypothetical protein